MQRVAAAATASPSQSEQPAFSFGDQGRQLDLRIDRLVLLVIVDRAFGFRSERKQAGLERPQSMMKVES